MNTRCVVTAAALSLFLLLAKAQSADEPAAVSARCAELRQQMEAAARGLSHFATSDIIHNRHMERRWPEEMELEQAQLLKDLLQWAQHPECLKTLMNHSDARVRTLVLGALFVREDAHDLPLIASRADDSAPTFLQIQESMNSAPGPLPMAEFEKAQSVGDVAKAMLDFYVRAFPGQKLSFDEYWKPREMRKHCASWLLAKLHRADRQTSPLQPDYLADTQRVLDEINALPMPDRAWTLLYVRTKSHPKLDPPSPEAACVAALKEAGSAQIMQFLERRRVTDDPDLWFDTLDRYSGHAFESMATFILRHARGLLQVQDAPALLACEIEQRRMTPKTMVGASPYWAAAAAELTGGSDVNAAVQMIEKALERFPLEGIIGGRHQAVLTGALWRIAGTEEKQRIVDWFYLAQARVNESRSDASNHGPADFLYLVRSSKRPDIPEFLAALVADEKFDQTDWYTLMALLETASDGLPAPLVSQQDIYAASPARRRADQEEVLAEWRKILRRHFRG